MSFNKLCPITVTKIVDIKYAIYQGLSERRLCREYVRRKVNITPELNLRRKFAFSTCSLLLPSPRSNGQTATGQRSTSKQHAWERDTGQRIACYDSCLLIVKWMPRIKDMAMIMVLLSCFSRYWVHTNSHVTTNFF